jgi:S1-C subfamily serine protease
MGLVAFLCVAGFAYGQKADLAELKEKAQTGDAEAQYQLAVIYDTGVGVLKSYSESGKWYLKAANQGIAEAQFVLGSRYYEYGKKSKENYKTAFSWFYKAAKQGLREAQFNTGVMYGLGQGVPTNNVEAYKWLVLASAQGSMQAMMLREGLATELTAEQMAEAERQAAAFVAKRIFKPQIGLLGDSSARPKSVGTGFFITEDGYLVTNFHVVEDAESYAIKTRKGTFPAQLIKSDKGNDIALLKVSGIFNALPISTNRQLRLGQSVFTIGFPNPDMQGLEPKLTRGEISSLAGMKDDARHYQISVPVQPGNSGGPLVDMAGNAVGIVTMRLGDYRTLRLTGALPQNVNYAVKGSFLSSLLDSLPDMQAKLKTPNPSAERKFDDVVKEVEDGVVMVMAY